MEKISQYTEDGTSMPIQAADLMDFSNNVSPAVYDESKKILVSEFLTFLETNVLNIYNANGILQSERTIVSPNLGITLDAGNITIEMNDEVTDHAFLLENSGGLEWGRYGIDQISGSGILELSNLGGIWFDANDGEVEISGQDDLLGTSLLYGENASAERVFGFRNNGAFVLGLASLNTDLWDVSGTSGVFQVAQNNGMIMISNAPADGVTNNANNDNQSLGFNTRNDNGDIVEVAQLGWVKNRSVAAGSEYGVVVINNAIQTENPDGTSARTIISTSRRETSGSAAAILEVENRHDSAIATAFQVACFDQSTQLSLGVRSGSAGTVDDTWNWRLKNNHEFEHNWGQLATGDFIMRSLNSASTFCMNAGTDNVGFGTLTPNVNALVEFTSTTKGVRYTPMTVAQAGAITAVEGLVVFVSDTDATFPTIGLYCYESASWNKL